MFTIDVVVYQDDGRFAAAIEGLSLKSLPPEALRLTSGTGDSPKQTAGADPASPSAGAGVAGGVGGPIKKGGGGQRAGGAVVGLWAGGREEWRLRRNDSCARPPARAS